MFVVCMGKQTDSVFGGFGHCDLAPPRSLLTRGSGHVELDLMWGVTYKINPVCGFAHASLYVV